MWGECFPPLRFPDYKPHTIIILRGVFDFFAKKISEPIPKKCIFATSILEIMNAKRKYIRYIVLLFCTVLMFALASCQSSHNTPHHSSKYQKVRTKHQPNWNATTSQSTTYYIKKNSTRKSHDSKKVKR